MQKNIIKKQEISCFLMKNKQNFIKQKKNQDICKRILVPAAISMLYTFVIMPERTTKHLFLYKGTSFSSGTG